MREKLKAGKKRIFENACVAVNVKSKKILSMMKVIMDEHIHDSKVLPELVENIIKSNNMTAIGKIFADGAYNSFQKENSDRAHHLSIEKIQNTE